MNMRLLLGPAELLLGLAILGIARLVCLIAVGVVKVSCLVAVSIFGVGCNNSVWVGETCAGTAVVGADWVSKPGVAVG